MTTKKRTVGKPISLNEALSMTDMYAKLKSITKTVVSKNAAEDLRQKAEVMVNKASSAFVFSKANVMRLFDGSQIDELGKPVSANHLMIMLGAHPVASPGYEAGAFTLLTVGCEKIEVNGQTKYYPLTNFNLPANEYGSGTPPPPPPPPPGNIDIDTYEGIVTSQIFGKPISWNEALSMTGMYAQLKSITKTFIDQDADQDFISKAEVMVNKGSSAIVFSRETVTRLFDGSQIDDAGNPVSADYLMIMLAAHPVASEGFEAGAFALVTVGCNKVEVNGKTKYRLVTNFDLPANDYGSGTPPPPPPPGGGNIDIDTYEGVITLAHS